MKKQPLCGKIIVLFNKRKVKIMKRLVKSSDRRLLGVCGGIAEYFNLDPNVVRILWVVFCLLGGSGVLAYIIAALIMPNE